MSLTADEVDARQRQWIEKQVAAGKAAIVVGCPLDLAVLPGNILTTCEVCGVEMYLRNWLYDIVKKHGVKTLCIKCVNVLDSRLLKGQFVQDMARLGLADGDAKDL